MPDYATLSRHCEQCGGEFFTFPSRVRKGEARFCSRTCHYAYKHRPEVIAARFWAKVDQSAGPDGCWPWLRGLNSEGYGHFSADGVDHIASRFAYAFTYGPIPDGLFALHSCDNPPCCNPAHLWLGDHDINMADAVQKGRMASGERSFARQHPERQARGSRQGLAKLTEAAVLDIRARHAAGGVILNDLAQEYGVSLQSISYVITRHTWKHI